MTTTLGSILVGTTDPDRLCAWYCAAFNVEPVQNGFLAFGEVSVLFEHRPDVAARNPEPGRVILNFHVTDAQATAAHLDRFGRSACEDGYGGSRSLAELTTAAVSRRCASPGGTGGGSVSTVLGVRFVEPLVLTGELVVLEPLQASHHDALVEAASDGQLWTLSYTRVPRPEQMRDSIANYLALKPKDCWFRHRLSSWVRSRGALLMGGGSASPSTTGVSYR